MPISEGMCGVSSMGGMSSMCGPPVNVSKGIPESIGATGGGGGGGGGMNGLPRHAASAGIVAHAGSFGPVGRGDGGGGAGGAYGPS
jgi:hypothetical protein